MGAEFAVVDLFAGPGGLAEGFSSIRDENGNRPFKIVLSVEKEPSAYATLLLRGFLRQFANGYPEEYYAFLNGRSDEPDWEKLYPNEWRAAAAEAVNRELGTRKGRRELNRRLDSIRRTYKDRVILIGGPPCQAYSLVGRARNRGVEGYNASKDHRHFLYREYIRILNRLRPVVFVMENVKGLLSSVVDGESVFEKVLDDLQAAGGERHSYQLMPLAGLEDAEDDEHFRFRDFVVEAEKFGLPQARHRVIVVGVRNDFASGLSREDIRRGLLTPSPARVTVRDVLGGLPRLRSSLSEVVDSEDEWRKTVVALMQVVARLKPPLSEKRTKAFRIRALKHSAILKRRREALERTSDEVAIGTACPRKLRSWLLDPSLKKLPNHNTRSHMASDLARYFFAAVFAQVTGVSPKASHYPHELAPKHKNWKSGKFADRFRVQLWSHPSTTVTSHISKDGHYFIHPDPLQCRSLTVREAARLQTFPDNYFFKGNRTQQYVQVGNAVPPYLARQIGAALHSLLQQQVKARVRGRKPKRQSRGISLMKYSSIASSK
jgi:DNA (cytosine-5)-methyltransferase 1